MLCISPAYGSMLVFGPLVSEKSVEKWKARHPPHTHTHTKPLQMTGIPRSSKTEMQDKYTQLLVVKFTVSTLDNCFKMYMIWISDVFDVDCIFDWTLQTVCLFVCSFLLVHAVCQEPIKDAKCHQMPWLAFKNLQMFLGEAPPQPPNKRGGTPSHILPLCAFSALVGLWPTS